MSRTLFIHLGQHGLQMLKLSGDAKGGRVVSRPSELCSQFLLEQTAQHQQTAKLCFVDINHYNILDENQIQ